MIFELVLILPSLWENVSKLETHFLL